MRRFRITGLAISLALALTAAIGVASASATSGFLADEYPATFNGQTSLSTEITTEFGFSCELSITLSGTSDVPTPTTIMNGEKGTCTASGYGVGTVNMGSCKFVFNVGRETADIGPAGCGPVTIDWNQNCDGRIYPTSGMDATYYNASSSTGSAEIVDNLDFRWVGAFCQFSEKPGSWINLDTPISAKNSGGSTIGVQVEPIPGVYMTGAAASWISKGPKLEANGYPMSISSDGADQFTLALTPGSIACTTTLDGEVTNATDELPLDITFSNCLAQGQYPTVAKSNGCDFGLGVTNAGPPYKGRLLLNCEEEAGPFEFQVFNSAEVLVCTIKLGTQVRFGIGLTNVFDTETGIEVAANSSGWSYSTGGVGCGANSYENGVLSGTATLFGV